MKVHNYMLIGLFFSLAGCKKEAKVETVDFEVSVDKISVRVDEEVNFSFKGTPGLVTFYSGEPKNSYTFKDEERIAKLATLKMSFETSIQAVATTPLTVLYSTDFKGIYDYANINSTVTQWIDVTDRCVMAQTTYPVFEASGEIDLSDLLVDGKPFYIAFRYDAPAHTAPGALPIRRWRMRNFKLGATTNYGFDERLAWNTVGTAGWQFVSREPDYVHISAIPAATGTLVLFAPPSLTTQVGYKQPMQLWLVSKAFVPQINMGVDHGVSIKNYQTSSINSYKYIYTKPGIYKVVFVAANTNIYDSKELVREIEITVTP